VRFAGFAKASRRRSLGVLITAAVWLADPASAQAQGTDPQDAHTLYVQGVSALKERRYEDARDLLLRVVAADPAFAGAWLDLAIAAYGAGDIVQAEEFLGILEARFALPDAISRGVANLRERMQAVLPAPSGWVWRTVAQAGGGYDSNANAGLAVRDLTLTFPGGGVSLPLSPSLKPRSDAYAMASVATDGVRKEGGGQLEVAVLLKGRGNAAVRDFNTLEMQGSLAFSSNAPAFDGTWGRWLPGPWRTAITIQHLRLGGSTLLNSLAFSAMHAWSRLPCGPQSSLEIDLREFPAAPNLDSRLFWLGASAACPTPVWGSSGGWNGRLRLGHEGARRNMGADSGRPGGSTWHLEAAATHHWVWDGRGGPHRLEALLQWSEAQDTDGYSPLLADNERRHVRRITAGLSYSFPVRQGWLGTLAVQGFRQNSNLALFKLRGHAVQFSIQNSF